MNDINLRFSFRGASGRSRVAAGAQLVRPRLSPQGSAAESVRIHSLPSPSSFKRPLYCIHDHELRSILTVAVLHLPLDHRTYVRVLV